MAARTDPEPAHDGAPATAPRPVRARLYASASITGDASLRVLPRVTPSVVPGVTGEGPSRVDRPDAVDLAGRACAAEPGQVAAPFADGPSGSHRPITARRLSVVTGLLT